METVTSKSSSGQHKEYATGGAVGADAVCVGEVECNPVPATYLGAYTILTVVILAIMYWAMSLFYSQYLAFEKSNSYPSFQVLILGTFLSIIVLAYGCFLLSNTHMRNFSLIVLVLFFIFMFFWVLNLDRKIFYAEGETQYVGYGGLYLLLALITALTFFAYVWMKGNKLISTSAVPAILWVLVLFYLWTSQ